MYELACGEASATSMEKEKNSGKSGKQKAQEDDSICHLSYSSWVWWKKLQIYS